MADQQIRPVLPTRVLSPSRFAELGIAAAIGALAALALWAWSAKGVAVYLEALAAGLVTCF